MRKFLYTIVFLIVLVAAVLFALRLYSDELTEIALVPTADFVEQDALQSNAYQNPSMWFSRPGMGAPNDPARWQPSASDGRDVTPDGVTTPAPERSPNASPLPDDTANNSSEGPETPRFATFFVHPTSFYDNRAWNAGLDDTQSQATARVMVRGLGSAFNKATEIWAPRYRQATFGAFISDTPEANRAIESAYRDITLAFDYFIDSIDPDMPIVLAGHSQGAWHVQRLLQDKVLGTWAQQRVAMVYPIGWPISVAHDLPALGLPACATAEQGGCIMGWASFGEPAEPGQFIRRYAATPGFDGEPRGESAILCVNPISGVLNGSAPASANLGTLVPNEDMSSGELIAGQVGARCNDDGLLLIGDPPELGRYVLPGNNYHVYDIPLFWQNLQEDVVRRVDAWTRNR